MPPLESPSISETGVETEALFSGLVRSSSGGKETIDYLSAVAAFGRCVAAAPDVSVLLRDAFELAALVIQTDLLLVAQRTKDGKKLTRKIVAFDEHRKAVVQCIEPATIDPSASAAAFAMHCADITHVENISAETRFTDLLLRRRMMGSGLFVPLCTHNRAYGAVGLGRAKAGSFSRDETNFAASIVQLLASYLSQRSAETQSQSCEASTQTMLDSVGSLILTLDANGVVQEMNAAGERISGFRSRELRDRPFWITLIAPGESDRVAAAFRANNCPGDQITFDAELLSKDGQQYAVRWSLCATEANADTLAKYILSGIDGTELRECARELERFRKIAQGANKAAQQSSRGSRHEPPRSFGPPIGAEKRRSPRREYFYFQRVAPMTGKSLPADDEFKKVVCCDISAGGFSFLAEEHPGYEELVISLGTPPDDRKVLAKIVRVSTREVDGQQMHQIGCQFLGRVEE